MGPPGGGESLRRVAVASCEEWRQLLGRVARKVLKELAALAHPELDLDEAFEPGVLLLAEAALEHRQGLVPNLLGGGCAGYA